MSSKQKTISREDIAEHIRDVLDLKVVSQSAAISKSITQSLLDASLQNANLLIYFQMGADPVDRFVNVSLHNVTKGELISEIAMQRSAQAIFLDPLTEWLQDQKSLMELTSPLDSVKFAQRLESTNRCADLAEFASEYDEPSSDRTKKIHESLKKCRYRLVRMMEIPQNFLLRVSPRGLSANKANHAVSEVERLKIREAVFRISRYFGELQMNCKSDCESKQVSLSVLFDHDRYCANLTDPKEFLAPFNPVAQLLLRLSEKLSPSKAPIELVVSVSDQSPMRAVIEGNSESPKIEPSPVLRNFLQQAAICPLL